MLRNHYFSFFLSTKVCYLLQDLPKLLLIVGVVCQSVFNPFIEFSHLGVKSSDARFIVCAMRVWSNSKEFHRLENTLWVSLLWLWFAFDSWPIDFEEQCWKGDMLSDWIVLFVEVFSPSFCLFSTFSHDTQRSLMTDYTHIHDSG